jgi:hypothetical protein
MAKERAVTGFDLTGAAVTTPSDATTADMMFTLTVDNPHHYRIYLGRASCASSGRRRGERAFRDRTWSSRRLLAEGLVMGCPFGSGRTRALLRKPSWPVCQCHKYGRMVPCARLLIFRTECTAS